MRPEPQRGIMLLPVVLTVAIVGTLAFAMTREAGMSVAAVDAEYDIARVRYLAEAGLTLAKWQNEQEGCGHTDRHRAVIALPGGSVTIDSVGEANHGIDATVTATLSPANAGATSARLTLSRAIQMYNLGSKNEILLGDRTKGSDTHIRRGIVAAADTLPYVELTDDQSHGLLRIALDGVPKDVIVTKAELRLTFDSSGQAGTGMLGMYRATQNWDPKNANWTAPFPDGGAALGPAVATGPVTRSSTRTWRIDALAEAWANDTQPQFGLLLKPTGLSGARFHSLNGSGSSPELFVRYYPRCPK